MVYSGDVIIKLNINCHHFTIYPNAGSAGFCLVRGVMAPSALGTELLGTILSLTGYILNFYFLRSHLCHCSHNALSKRSQCLRSFHSLYFIALYIVSITRLPLSHSLMYLYWFKLWPCSEIKPSGSNH